MNGDDLHQVAVAFQPQLGGVVTAFVVTLGLQPAVQGLGRRVLGSGLVQVFGQVQQVGEAARAVGRGQQALGHLLGVQPVPQHEADTAAAPQRMVVGKALQGGHQPRLVVGQGLDLWRVQAQPAGGQRGLEQALAGGLQHGGQHTLQLFGVGAAEDAGLRQLHAAHAQQRQRLAHHAALGVAAHQHRDVTGAQGTATQRDAAGRGLGEQAGDLAGAGVGRRGAGLGLEQRLAVPGLAGQRPHLQRGAPGQGRRAVVVAELGLCGLVADVVQPRLRLGALGHRVVLQPGLHEGPRLLAEQPVQRRDQRQGGALVGQQGVARRGQCAGAQVGVQVGMAKAVDRLFRVAHQEQRRGGVAGRRGAAVDRLEHRKLQWVGVLELVDQRGRKARQQGRGQARRLATAEPVMQVEQHVVEGHHAAGALGLAQAGRAVGQQLAQQPQAGQAERLVQRAQRVEQGLRRVEKRVAGRLLVLLGALLQRGAAVQHQLRRQRGHRRRRQAAGQQGVPALAGGEHAVFLVDRAVELFQAVDQRGGDGFAACRPERAGVAEGRGHGECQRISRCISRRIDAGRPDRLRQGLGQLALQQPGIPLGRVATGQQVGHQCGLGGLTGHLQPPEVMHHLQPQQAVVLQQGLHQRHVGGKWRVGQRPLAKAVDGEDGGFVKGLQCLVKQQRHCVIAGARAGALAGQQVGDERVTLARRRRRAQARQRIDDAAAHPFTQLGGGGVGEGDDQDLLHGQPLFQQQAQVQAADVPGFAGAGRGLDQLDAGQRAAEHV